MRRAHLALRRLEASPARVAPMAARESLSVPHGERVGVNVDPAVKSGARGEVRRRVIGAAERRRVEQQITRPSFVAAATMSFVVVLEDRRAGHELRRGLREPVLHCSVFASSATIAFDVAVARRAGRLPGCRRRGDHRDTSPLRRKRDAADHAAAVASSTRRPASLRSRDRSPTRRSARRRSCRSSWRRASC